MSAEAPWLDAPVVADQEPWKSAPVVVNKDAPWESAPIVDDVAASAPADFWNGATPPDENLSKFLTPAISPDAMQPTGGEKLPVPARQAAMAAATQEKPLSLLTPAPSTILGYAGAGAIGESAALDNPAIKSGEDFEKAYTGSLIEGALPRPQGEAFAGVRRAEDVLEGLVSPLNLALAGTVAGLPAVLQKVAGAGFTAQMAKSAADKVPDIGTALAEGDYTKAGELLVEAGGESLMATGGLAHMTGRARIAPLTAKAASETEPISPAPAEPVRGNLAEPAAGGTAAENRTPDVLTEDVKTRDVTTPAAEAPAAEPGPSPEPAARAESPPPQLAQASPDSLAEVTPETVKVANVSGAEPGFARTLEEIGLPTRDIAQQALSAPAPVREIFDGWRDKASGIFKAVDAAKRFIDASPQRDQVAATFDAADNLAGMTARQARRHVEIASGEKRLSSNEEALRQRAATFVRQAAGDKEGMLAKFAAIKGKGFDAIIEYAKKHWDDLEQIADAARTSTDSAYMEAKNAGVTIDYRDNYVKGSYHDVPTGKVIFDETRGAGTSGSFKKAKVFNDYAEAIAAGYKPKELRLDLLTESAVNATLRAVNRQKWAQSLGEIKMPDGAPLVTEPLENGSAPKGYRMVQVTRGRLMPVLDDLAPTIEALTRDSMIPKLISSTAATIKHNILVFDIFHASRFAQMQGAFEARLPSYHKGLALLEFADSDLAAAQKRGLVTSEEALWAKTNRPKLEALVKSGLNAGRISDALFKDAAAILPGVKSVNTFIFDKLSRGVITQSAIYALERNAKLYPKMSEAELLRYTAKEVNTYYRNLGNQGIFRSKTFQDLARAIFLAPQWVEGMVRSEARGYGQLAKSTVTGKVGNIGKGLGTGLAAYFAATQLVNLLTRGKPTWENDEPGHKLDAWVPDVLEGSNGYFVSPLSVFAETSHDAMKYIERGKNPADVPAQLLDNKLSPQVRAFRDLFYGKDFYGRPLQGFDRVTQAALDVAPIPLFARTGGYKGGMERQILSTAGIKATTAPSSTSDIYQLARDFKHASGVKVPEIVEESDYAKLRRALQNGDAATAKQEFETLKQSKGAAKIDAYFSQYPRRAFTGSTALETKFKKSLDRGQLDIYNAALREREETAKLYRSVLRR